LVKDQTHCPISTVFGENSSIFAKSATNGQSSQFPIDAHNFVWQREFFTVNIGIPCHPVFQKFRGTFSGQPTLLSEDKVYELQSAGSLRI
jgi:hypothetical protein